MRAEKIIRSSFFLLFVLFVYPLFSQCCSGDCVNGYGSSINQYGDIYTGNFINGLYDGYAKMSFANGHDYSGFWVSGYRQGWGTLSYGNKVKYDGEWNKDKMQGDGTLYYPDGKKYIGQLRNNKPNGRGVFYDSNDSILADGFFEDGEFINDREMKNLGTSYLKTYKVNRLIQKYNINEFPFITGYADAFKTLKNAQQNNYESVKSGVSSENVKGQNKHEGNVRIPGASNCYVVADTYLANYGEFSSLEGVVKKFVEIYSQITASDKSLTIVNDMFSLEEPCIKRYIFLKDRGKYYSQDWLYLSIYEWKENQKYFLELGCGFGAGKIMKAIPGKSKHDEVFANNLILLLNDADNSFRGFTDNDSILTCMAGIDSLDCYYTNLELPGLSKLRYVPLRSSAIYKGVSGYAEAETKKEAKKIYHNLVKRVKNSLNKTYVYTESITSDKLTSEILFASFSEIHNDRTPVVRINLANTKEGAYQVLLAVQYDSFTIVPRQLPYSW